jgi:hypothetical protein
MIVRIFEHISKLFASTNNHLYLRQHIESLNRDVPCIPFLGIHIRYLVTISGSSSYFSCSSFIYFRKLQMTTSCLDKILEWQKNPYPFEAIVGFFEILGKDFRHQFFEEKDYYLISCYREQRPGKSVSFPMLASALCPLPSAFCPLPSALCPLPSALCPLLSVSP